VVVLLHGAAGGWDELAIAAVAVGVLWVAVKLAGRKPASDDDEDHVAEEQAERGLLTTSSEEERQDPTRSSPKLG
jgi:hypothetical protein